jgi:hypothetical protein
MEKARIFSAELNFRHPRHGRRMITSLLCLPKALTKLSVSVL